jgi:sorting nexin-1/2
VLTCLRFKMAFSSRVRVYHAWQNADAELRQVKQAHERNRAQGKIVADRLGNSYSQIGEVRLCIPALATVIFL